MGRLPSVAELSKCLLEAGPQCVLDVALPRLIAAVGDLDTRELLEHLASDQRGYSLRSILRFDELDPWVARTCTAGESALMQAQLQAWLSCEEAELPELGRRIQRPAAHLRSEPHNTLDAASQGAAALEHGIAARSQSLDAPTLAHVPIEAAELERRGTHGTPTPAHVPTEAAELERWAGARGAQDLLRMRSEDVAARSPIALALPAGARTLLELCQLDAGAGPADAACRPGALARAFLRDQVDIRSQQRRRDKTWPMPLPRHALARLEQRLREALGRCAGATDPAPLESRTAGCAIDRRTGEASATLCSDGRQRAHGRFGVFRCSIHIHGYEDLPLRAHCECETAASHPNPLHRTRARAERMARRRQSGARQPSARQFSAARERASEPNPEAARAAIADSADLPQRMRSSLAANEKDAPASPSRRPSAAAQPRDARTRLVRLPRLTENATCLHVRYLAARLIDALHDARDPLHEGLRHVAEKPSWVRLFDSLDASAQAEEAGPNTARQDHSAQEQRLIWSARVQNGAVQVAPALQTRGRNGVFSQGARLAADAVPAGSAESSADPIALALLRAAKPGKGGFYDADLPVLRILGSHPRLFSDTRGALALAEGRLTLTLEPVAGGVSAHFSLDDRPIPAHGKPRERDHLALPVRDGRLLFAPLPAAVARWLWWLESAPTVLPPESYDALRERLIELQPHVELALAAELRGEHRAQAKRLLVRLAPSFSGEGMRISLHSRPLPFGPVWLPGQGPAVALGTQNERRVYVQRDLAWERSSASRLIEALRLDQLPQESPYRYRADELEAALQLLDALAQQAGAVEIEWLDGYRPIQLLPPIGRASLRIKIGDGRRWFEASGGAVLASGHQIALLELLEASRTGQRYVKVAPGTFAELQADLRERLKLAAAYVYSDRDKLKLAAWALPRLLELVDAESRPDLPPSAAELLERMRAAPALTEQIEPPAELRALLRPYQREGVRFLLRLAHWAAGACLADDMGLGKTLQALAVLLARRALGPALVVAPTSVCDNWLDEARRFAPGLHLRLYRGAGRARHLEDLGPGDVLVSSYELIQRDKAALSGIAFATQVLDEAHMLKNALSRRARAAAATHASFRIALTGTPLENHLGELWSLMSLLNPALLGSWRQFRAQFGVPIERDANQERLALLRRIIQPFVLRRSKSEVAPELPARLEITKRIALSEQEQTLYDAAASDVRKKLGSGRRLKIDHVSLLAEITRLRQLACHPRLLMPELQMQSSKLLALCELLDDILPNGHRALLFSQFVRHLELVRAELSARGHELLYLDGSTPPSERAALVRRWQAGETSLFLISLKAGGVGLNLTGADYVFHLDPWWNPAAEDQASDRAHRLGQGRPVAIIRLVAQATVEERVLALHHEKRELAQAILVGTDQPSRLDLEQLARMLELR